LLLSASVIISVISAEIVLEYREYLKEKEWGNQLGGFYQWSYFTSEGKRISRRPGYIKFAMHPFLLYCDMPGQKTPYFTINSQGFRGKREYGQKGAAKRIVVLGGSTAFGAGLNRDEDVFTVEMEKRLGDVEVINAGVQGYQSGQELVFIVTDIIDLKPDLIITLDGWNDASQIGQAKKVYTMGANEFAAVEFQLREHYIFTKMPFMTRLANIPRIIFPQIDILFRRAVNKLRRYLFGYVPIVTNDALTRYYQDVYEKYDRREDDYMKEKPRQIDVRTAADIYVKNISKMSKIASSIDCEFLCIIQPENVMSVKYSAFCKEAKKRLKERGIEYIDMNQYRDKFADSEFLDAVHMNAKGNIVLAELILDTIKSKGLLND